MKKTKIKKGYKKGDPVFSGKKINRPEIKGELFAGKKQFYIKGPGGKFIPVPMKMMGSKKIAKKGGKV